MSNKMIIIGVCFLLALAFLAWGVRLAFYKHPPDYTEGEVTITSSTVPAASSSVPMGPASTSSPVAQPASGNTVTVDGHTFAIDLADTMAKRAQGLSGREPLGVEEGMLFIFPTEGNYGFWMKDMKFDLDMIWIKGNVVVGVTADVPAPKAGENMFNLPNYYPPEPIDKVLEVNAGTAKKYGINAGDVVVLKMSEGR